MLERRPAATADYVDPKILDEFGQRLGQTERNAMRRQLELDLAERPSVVGPVAG